MSDTGRHARELQQSSLAAGQCEVLSCHRNTGGKKREMRRISIDRSTLNLIVQKAAATANARTVRRQTDERECLLLRIRTGAGLASFSVALIITQWDTMAVLGPPFIISQKDNVQIPRAERKRTVDLAFPGNFSAGGQEFNHDRRFSG